MIKREIKLPRSNHFFLLGPRQTGKTTLVLENFPKAQVYNLLFSEEYTRLVANPRLFREEVLALSERITHVFVDEIQRVPELLNEIQALIDAGVKQKFILSGSSARKLKLSRANLLAGRVWSYHLHPLTLLEMAGRAKLNRILTYGSLPPNVVAGKDEDRQENLRSYVNVYLREEIEAEALSRNIGGFIRFLAVAAQANAEQINCSNIARDVGLSSVTVKEYFRILEDTLIGFFLLPFSFSERKKHKLSPKFYFFDTGVLRALQKRLTLDVAPQTYEFGNYFETWIINESMRISEYGRKDFSFSFLRTAASVEVDLIIETPRILLAIEIKSKEFPDKTDFVSGFEAVQKIAPRAKCICVCTGKTSRLVEGYSVMPYQEYFDYLRKL